MNATCITVGVFALDQILLPGGGAAKGWPQRLAEGGAALADGAEPVALSLALGPDGPVLARPARLGRTLWPEGANVQVEDIAGRQGLFLVRCGGKPAALAMAAPWTAGDGLPEGAHAPPEAPAAFAAGTLIDTPDGPRPAGSLTAGDVVTTLSNGSRPLRWVGRRRVSAIEMLARPGLRPVVLAPGLLGNARELVVSARQRLLIDDWRAEVYFGEDRVLVSAGALVDDQGVRPMLAEAGVEYVVLLCDRHEVLLAEGALSESFHPGDEGLEGLDAEARATLAQVVSEADLARRRAAYPILRGSEARALRLQG
ncbi:Hint domain-containing protein [Rhodobacter calidifons]|uniref:Hint domain-containing protein n=1 Tax=Rhodobacter calidifons TaxID=2715277 RepID=A0ABX0G2X6_9RHOB|nr:Hint domain-containing protein [Rhodobacter calidifons]NHB75500.1 Hint domain-containing protein [Rhodobacter calidifons]